MIILGKTRRLILRTLTCIVVLTLKRTELESNRKKIVRPCKDSLKEEKVDRKYKSVDPEYVSIQMKAIQQYFHWYFVSYYKRLF